MNTRFRRVTTLLAVVAFASVSAAASGQGITSKLSVTDVLTKSLGVSKDQAEGGVGSILSLAQGKLQASDYTKVASAVPGADQYVQKAKDLGAVPAEGISNKSGLDAAYSKLGISPEVGSKVTSTVVDYVGKVGGGSVKSLLAGVLK